MDNKIEEFRFIESIKFLGFIVFRLTQEAR